MRAQQQVGRVVSGKVIPTGVLIGVVRVECGLPAERVFKVWAFACRLVESQCGADHRRIVGSKTWKKQFAITPGMSQPVSLGHAMRNKGERTLGHREPIRLVLI